MHSENSGWKREVETAARQWNELTKAANAEHSAAQYVLGKLYQDGVYFNKDMDQAMKWFRSAAELGNEYAAYRMGCLLLLGGNTEGCGSGCEVAQSVSGKKEIRMRSIGLECYISQGEEFSPKWKWQ